MLQEKILCVTSSKIISNYRLNSLSKEGHQISVNNSYLSLALRKSGEIGLLNFLNPEKNYKTIQINKNNIIDLEFSPHNNNILSVSYQNKTIISIIEFNTSTNEIKCKDLNHKGKIVIKNFNPILENLLCSCTVDGMGYVWDYNKESIIWEFNTEKEAKGILWSPNGNLIGICYKNKKLEIFDKNNKKKIYEKKISDKELNVNNFAWVNDNIIITVGWENNKHIIKLWDIYNNNNIEELLIQDNINDTNDIIPFVNQEKKLIYLVRKEEYTCSKPSIVVYYLNESNRLEKKCEYNSLYPSFCTVLLNDKTYQKNKNEIDTFAQYSAKDNKICYVYFFYQNNSSDKLLININENNNVIIEEEEKVIKENEEQKLKSNKCNKIQPKVEHKNEFKNLEKQSENFSIIQKDSKEKLNLLKSHLENQKKINEEFQNKNELLIKDNEDLIKENEKNKEIIETLKNELKIQENINSQLNNSLKEKEKELKEQSINYEKQLSNLKEKSNNQIAKLKEELDKEIYKKDLFIFNRLSELKELNLEISKLSSDKEEIEKILSEIKNELNNKNKILEEKYKEIENLSKLKEQLTKELELLRKNKIDINNINNKINNRNCVIIIKNKIALCNLDNNIDIFNPEYKSFEDIYYSYICFTPDSYLEGLHKYGEKKKEITFDIILVNNGPTKWADNTQLIQDRSSDFEINSIYLEPQKRNESNTYTININNVEIYPPGNYEAVLLFQSGGKTFGKKLKYKLIIYDGKFIDEFRKEYNLNNSDEQLYYKLKDNYFNFESASKSLKERN